MKKKIALKKAQEILERLNIPKNLWNLSPLTFSGGEQQRVNIARGFIHNYPTIAIDGNVKRVFARYLNKKESKINFERLILINKKSLVA